MTKSQIQNNACSMIPVVLKNTEQIYIAQHTSMCTEMCIKGSVRITYHTDDSTMRGGD